jgi:hypothetical protein
MPLILSDSLLSNDFAHGRTYLSLYIAKHTKISLVNNIVLKCIQPCYLASTMQKKNIRQISTFLILLGVTHALIYIVVPHYYKRLGTFI